MILEPYAVHQQWCFDDAGKNNPEKFFSEYIERIAYRCTTEGAELIGHIKGLAMFSDDQYFQVSVIAPDIPPSSEGGIPCGTDTIEFTLNVIVYGIDRKTIKQIVSDEAEKETRSGLVSVNQAELMQEGEHHHHHHC